MLILLLCSLILFICQLPGSVMEGLTPAPNHVVINTKRKHIEADTSWLEPKKNEVQKISLNADNPQKVILDLINSKKQLSASAQGNIAVAGNDEHHAQVQRFGNKGGIAQIEGHKAQIKMKEDKEGRHAFLKADGKYKLDTVARGSLKDPKDTNFVATNERFDFALNPHTQNEREGTGIVSYVDKQKHREYHSVMMHRDVALVKWLLISPATQLFIMIRMYRLQLELYRNSVNVPTRH